MKLIVVLLMILALNFIDAHSGSNFLCMASSCQDCVKYSNCVWCDTRCIGQSDKMQCSSRISDSSMCQESSLGSNCCNYKGQRYNFGDKFMDSCNNCTCLESGVSCTKKVCASGCETVQCMSGYSCVMENNSPVCKPNGGSSSCETVRCMSGYSCVMENNSPVCKPMGGSSSCENVQCMEGCSCVMENNSPVCKPNSEPSGTSCDYNGMTYQNGDSFPSTDGCNQCSCNNGRVLCTLRACLQTCNYQGNTYNDGDSFPAGDGCNTCDCTGGRVICTEMACVQPTQPSQPQPQQLNCRNNNDCDSEYYCAKLTCDCEQGTCTERSLSCNGGSSVCGCDGQTYNSECDACRLGANVRSNGACPAT